jgi:hypothetical protein
MRSTQYQLGTGYHLSICLKNCEKPSKSVEMADSTTFPIRTDVQPAVQQLKHIQSSVCSRFMSAHSILHWLNNSIVVAIHYLRY